MNLLALKNLESSAAASGRWARRCDRYVTALPCLASVRDIQREGEIQSRSNSIATQKYNDEWIVSVEYGEIVCMENLVSKYIQSQTTPVSSLQLFFSVVIQAIPRVWPPDGIRSLIKTRAREWENSPRKLSMKLRSTTPHTTRDRRVNVSTWNIIIWKFHNDHRSLQLPKKKHENMTQFFLVIWLSFTREALYLSQRSHAGRQIS